MFQKYKRIIFLLCSITFLLLFFLFSFIVKKQKLSQFDFNMTVYVQDDTPLKLNKIFPYFSFLASVEGMLVLLILLLLFRRKILQGVMILVIFLASHVVELFGKLYINHPPPPFMFYKHLDASTFNFNKYYVQTGNSYPSGHSFRTTFLVILFIYTVYTSKRLSAFMKAGVALCAIGFLCLVGISRVALGEHWTTDVIGGGLFGIASGMFTVALL